MKIGFDKVYCVSYCRNIEKQKNIKKIMKYLDIDFTFIYGADYSNLEILKNEDFYFLREGKEKEQQLKDNNFKHYTHFIGASYDHYTAVIHAYESGANSVLIMEDDCTFINDVSYIQWALNNYPKDADIVKFGYVSIYDLLLLKPLNFNVHEQHNFFSRNDDRLCFSGSQLYGICNRETMKKYIDLQQNDFHYVDAVYSILNINFYGLVKPLNLDTIGYQIDLLKGYPNKYTLLEYIK